MRGWSVLRQLLAATLCAVLVAPAYPSESTLPRSSSTPSHSYDAQTLSKTRVWGSNQKILLHFRAVRRLSEKQHWGCEEPSEKVAVGSGVTYDYDAFGNLLHSTGTTFNEFLFAGEQFDSDLGLYYNRARYLNVSTGRFWSTDTFEGISNDPFSLHKYLYASADPVDRIDPSGDEDLVSLSIGSSIGNVLNNVTAIQGQAVMDQIQFGGSAGLKSLLLSGAIVGGAIAIESFASRFAREVPLLKAGSPGKLIINELSEEEAAFAQEIIEFRGGTFVGQTIKDTPGIDGFLEGVPASLKQLSSSSLGTLFKTVTKAAEQAQNAGYAGVELFIEAKNFPAKQLLSDASILPRIGGIVREGTLAVVNILTADGWIRVVR